MKGALNGKSVSHILRQIEKNIISYMFLLSALLFMTIIVIHTIIDRDVLTWWGDLFSISMNILCGCLTSFLFYYLLVVIPTERKQSRIKKNMLKMYRVLKEDILSNIVALSIAGGRDDLSGSLEDIRSLMNVETFRNTFSGGREGNEGFYAFENQMNDITPQFKSIILSLKLLSKQFDYFLHNYEIDDQEYFDKIKNVEIIILQLQETNPGYDESKPLCGFLYQMFSGWNWVDGYKGFDELERLIQSA